MSISSIRAGAGRGAYSVANQLSVVIAGTPLWAPLFFLFLALTIVMDIAVAVTFWRRTELAGIPLSER